MTSLWKMTQISKLKAGSFVEAGTGIPLNSESPSHGLRLIFHPMGQWQWALGAVPVGTASGTAPAPHTHWQAGSLSQGLSGTMGMD